MIAPVGITGAAARGGRRRRQINNRARAAFRLSKKKTEIRGPSSIGLKNLQRLEFGLAPEQQRLARHQ